MSETILWMGPVSAANLSGAVPAGWTLRVYNRGAGGGIGSDAFREWALLLGSDPISKLAPGASRVFVAGFSAAHGATEILLRNAARRGDGRICGLLAVDSYYSAIGTTYPKPGHSAWLQWVLSEPQGRRAWFTSSANGGPGHLSASDSLAILADSLSMEPRELYGSELLMPSAAHVRARGPVTWFDYQHRFSHKEHATKLARRALPLLLEPRSESVGGLVVAAALGALAYFVLKNRR